MNKIYKLIFNISTGTWAVAHELASARGKKTGRSRLAMAMAVALAAPAALPMSSAFASDTVGTLPACAKDQNQVETSGEKPDCEDGSVGSISAGVGASEGPRTLGGGFNTGGGRGISIAYAGSMTSVAVGNGDISIGGLSRADGGGANWATAVGDESRAIGADAAAFGARAEAIAPQTTAVGTEAVASAQWSLAVGTEAKSTAKNAVAIGGQATSDALHAVALGTNAKARAEYGLAIGSDTSATANYAVALGAGSDADRENTVSIGSASRKRQLVNLAAGTDANDATNVAQLNGVAAGLGGGAKVDADGTIIAPDYAVGGATFDNVGDALTNIDDRVTDNADNITQLQQNIDTGSVGLVKQDTTGAITVAGATGGTTVNFAGSDGARRLSGVGNGIADADATTVSQLRGIADGLGGGATVGADGSITAPSYAVDGATFDNVGDALTNLDGRTTRNTDDISRLKGDIDTGGVGLVKQDATTGAITVAGTTGGTTVNFGGRDGNRTLGGVADGAVSATSNEAVTGAQLFATNQRVAQNADSITQVDNRVTVNRDNITKLQDDINNGSVGLVKQDTTGAITVAGATGGTTVNFAGSDGARRLGGVSNGINDDEAVTLAQLKASGLVDPNDGRALGALVYDDMSLGRATLGGTNGTIIGNLGNGLIGAGSREAVNGGQLYDMNANWESRWNQMEDRVSHIEENGVPGTGTGPGTSPGTGDGSVAIGDGSNAEGSGSVAIGEGSSATGEGSVAIGEGSSASGDNSVAIGKGSQADGDNEFSVGAPGNERRITNVSAGIEDTDAVNLGQMNDRFQAERDWANERFQAVDKRMDRMAAMSAAYAGMAMNTAGLEGDNRIGAGVGAQNGRTALAVGYQRILGKKKNVSVSLGGAFSGSDKSVSAGTGLSW